MTAALPATAARSKAGSQAEGLSLQGFIAALCKTALEVFGGQEWHAGFPAPTDKLRLAIMHLLSCDALPTEAEYSELESELKLLGADTTALAYIRKLRKNNLVGPVKGKDADAGTLAGLGLVVLSGLIFPVENIPGGLRWLSNFVWGRYYMEIVRDALLEGGGWPAMWFNVVVIGIIGSVFFLLAWRKMRRMQLSI